MTSSFRLYAGLFIVGSLAAGCSASGSTPSSPSSVRPDQLVGSWTVVSIQPVGQLEQATPAGAVYTLTFADSRLSTRVDCNTCNGAFSVWRRILTAGPELACSRAACPTMAFGTAYIRLLNGESTITLSGGALVLSSGRGVLRLTR